MNAHAARNGSPDMLAHALEYALFGWPVFPCNPSPAKGAGKRPLTPHGYKDATCDLDTIQQWWSTWPNALIGVPMGKESGIFAIDPDAPDSPDEPDGIAAWERLVAEHGGMSPVPMHLTPGGGRHVLFNWREDRPVRNKTGRLPTGIHVRGEGGYIIVPPSQLTDGRSYRVADSDIYWSFPDAPEWLYDLLLTSRSGDEAANVNSGVNSVFNQVGDFHPYAEEALRREREAVASEVPANRNNRLNQAAFSLGQLVGGGVLEERRVREELLEAAIDNGLVYDDGEDSALRTIESGLEAGKKQPRGIPSHDRIPIGTQGLHQTVRATPYHWTNPRDIPPRQFLYGRHFARGFVSATVATCGVGKTALKIAEALAMASGRDLLAIGGTGPPLRVWYWNLEDPRDELTRRIQATAMRFGLDIADIDGRLFVDTGREQELIIADPTRSGAMIRQPVVDALVQEIVANIIDVLIVDPFVSCHRVSENDNTAIDLVAKEWGRVAHRANCAVELVHHTRKPLNGESEATTDSARGAKALTDACRSVETINRMTAKEGEKVGVQSHRFYFRTLNDKNNLAPPAADSVWYKLESVALGNGPSFGDTGDNIGVVARWKWPDASALVSTGDLRRVQERVAAGKWRKDPQARDWVGKPVAEVLGLDHERRADRARIGELLKGWIDTGRLKIVDGLDGNRQPRQFVEVGTWEQDTSATPQGAPP
jgi:hypothetical protein